MLSVIIPAYNEGKTLLKIIDKVLKAPVEKEIIVVDDGSIDGSREILQRLFINNLKIIYHDKNRGKGRSIRTALEIVKGDIVIIQDADLEYDPNDYLELIKPIVQGDSYVVYGSRELKSTKRSYIRYYLGGKFLTFLANLLYQAHISDEPTCYKVFKTDLLKSLNLNCSRFEFCPEVTAKIRIKGFKIKEVPISYFPRSIEEGKKIRWKDGLIAIWTLIKYRFLNF